MKRNILILYVIIMTVFISGCSGGNMNKTLSQSESDIKTKNSDDINSIVSEDTLFHADLIFHILKYIDLEESPANMYSQEYINKFENFRKQQNNTNNLQEKTKYLADSYRKYFDEVCFIAFCPFSYASYDEMKYAILNDKSISEDVMSEFIIPFMDCVNDEKQIYQLYWNSEINKNQENIDNFMELSNKYFQKLNNIFSYTGKTPQYYLCASLSGEGRGITNDKKLMAAVAIPHNEQEMINVFFQGFHEMTHQFTDNKFISDISMNDGTHLLSEKIVMMVDYKIFKNLEPALLNEYIAWTGEQAGVMDATEESFLEFYQLPEEQEQEINILIDEIIEIR